MLSDDQVERYARHIILPEVGGAGQQRLLTAAVLVVGAGGLGTPLLHYLAAAGVGHLGIVDDDRVSLSNLQRQVIHRTDQIDRPKVESAAQAIRALNPDVRVKAHQARLTPANADALIADYDLVCDGSDNFDTRYLLNDVCHRLEKTLVSGALLRFEGQLGTFKAHLGPEHPCYRCVFPEPPAPGTVAACAEAGILGSIAGVIGTLQATEVIKELLGLGDSLSGRLLLYDALTPRFSLLGVTKDPACPTCGTAATASASGPAKTPPAREIPPGDGR